MRMNQVPSSRSTGRKSRLGSMEGGRASKEGTYTISSSSAGGGVCTGSGEAVGAAVGAGVGAGGSVFPHPASRRISRARERNRASLRYALVFIPVLLYRRYRRLYYQHKGQRRESQKPKHCAIPGNRGPRHRRGLPGQGGFFALRCKKPPHVLRFRHGAKCIHGEFCQFYADITGTSVPPCMRYCTSQAAATSGSWVTMMTQ